jgi:hypothetical protein
MVCRCFFYLLLKPYTSAISWIAEVATNASRISLMSIWRYTVPGYAILNFCLANDAVAHPLCILPLS